MMTGISDDLDGHDVTAVVVALKKSASRTREFAMYTDNSNDHLKEALLQCAESAEQLAEIIDYADAMSDVIDVFRRGH